MLASFVEINLANEFLSGWLMRAPSVVDAGEQKEEDIINYDDPSVMIQRRLPISINLSRSESALTDLGVDGRC
jgi:hypothetical protein